MLVTYNIALELKKRKISFLCRGYYINNNRFGNIGEYREFEKPRFPTYTQTTNNFDSQPHICLAPTQAEVQTWLRDNRDNRGWNVIVYVIPFISEDPLQFQCHVWRRGETIILDPQESYEKSLDEGLLKGLKIFENENNIQT